MPEVSREQESLVRELQEPREHRAAGANKRLRKLDQHIQMTEKRRKRTEKGDTF